MIVDLDIIAQNVRVLKSSLAPGSSLMAVVKADAYGHGAVFVAQTALESGAEWLGVATVQEGRQLRQAGCDAPVLVLGPVDASEVASASQSGLAISVGEESQPARFASALESVSNAPPLEIHLEVDTGLRRYGVQPANAVQVAQEIERLPALQLSGILSHFSHADRPFDPTTDQQFQLFLRVREEIRSAGTDIRWHHLANSGGLFLDKRFHHDIVRTGITLYGYPPGPEVRIPLDIRPALSVVARVQRVIDLAPGDRVSYGGTYVAGRRERAVLLPIGYADGYPRQCSNRAWVAVSGSRCPVIGQVCMDQLIARVAVDMEVSVGQEVIVLGEDCAPDAGTLSEIAGTIPYHILTGFAARLPRIYLKGRDVVAVDDNIGQTSQLLLA